MMRIEKKFPKIGNLIGWNRRFFDMNFMMAFDVIVLLLGAYLVYCAFVMKKDGTIPSAIVPAQSMQNCRDPKGYAKYLFPWVSAFAVGSLIFGGLSLGLDLHVIDLGEAYAKINVVVIILFLLLWGLFSYALRKGHSKFF
jgi:hypothetical protein